LSEKRYKLRILHPNILAVAVEGDKGDWAAYIGVITGTRPETRWRRIYDSGNKLPKEAAEALFPSFAHLEWRQGSISKKEGENAATE